MASSEDCGLSDLPESMSDTEFRLRESLGRGAYNKLFLHNQGLIYNEVLRVRVRVGLELGLGLGLGLGLVANPNLLTLTLIITPNQVHKHFPNWRTKAVMEKADLLQEGWP